MARTFENLFRWMTPGWLRKGDGAAVLRSLARQLDESVTRFRAGLNARFPTRCNDDETLARVGADRGITRGRDETRDHYASRLTAWRYPRGHRTRGSAYALLEQVVLYLGEGSALLDANGLISMFDRTGLFNAYSRTFRWGPPDPSLWARFWITLCAQGYAANSPAWGDSSLWGGGFGSDVAIGLVGITPTDIATIRRLFSGLAWKPAGTQQEWLIVETADSGGQHFLPEGPYGTYPGVNYHRWSRLNGDTLDRARDPAFRYVSLDPGHNNTTSGDPDQFCKYAVKVDRSAPSFHGDRNSFPLSVTLPTGLICGGNSSRFPVNVQLVDDGSPS